MPKQADMTVFRSIDDKVGDCGSLSVECAYERMLGCPYRLEIFSGES